MTSFITADTHFNHKAIIGFCNRPWTSVGKMNVDMVERWNAVVTSNKVDVWHLGDFGYNSPEGHPLETIFAMLNGRKHLVVGNHDEQNKNVLKLPWVSIDKLVTLRDDGMRFEMCHYPLETWKSPAKYVMLHGHCHGSLFRTVPRRFDVGVDAMPEFNYAPIPLRYLWDKASKQVYRPQDHHGD